MDPYFFQEKTGAIYFSLPGKMYNNLDYYYFSNKKINHESAGYKAGQQGCDIPQNRSMFFTSKKNITKCERHNLDPKTIIPDCR